MIAVAADVRALIFDLDGTLADTMPLHYEAWHETLASLGLSCPQPFLEARKGVPTSEIVLQMNQAFGYDLDPKFFSRQKQERFRAKLGRVKPIPVVTDLALRQRGRLPMAVATGGTRRNTALILQTIGLQDCFDAVLTADDPVAPKPAPDIFLAAARLMNIGPRYCQVFEDGDAGLEAARRAGMVATDVRPFTENITGGVQDS